MIISTYQGKKRLLTLFPNLPHHVGQGYFLQGLLEAILGLLKNRAHASLDVRADRAPLLHRVPVNRECRGRFTGTIDLEKRDLFGRTCQHARPALSARRHDQPRLRELRNRLAHETLVRIYACGQRRRSYFLAMMESKSRHDVRCYCGLEAGRRHSVSLAYM